MRKLFKIILILILFISCKKDLMINIDSQKTSEKKIKTTISTNFPENTIFSITAERFYKRKNNSNNYSGTLYLSRDLPVKNGKIEFSFEINDKEWIDSYDNYRKFEKQNDKEFTEIDFNSIQDSIEITVFYEPRLERDFNVQKILGVKGENIKGKGTIKVDDFNIFSKTIKIYDKFER